MQGIASLITNVTNQAQQSILPAAVILALSVGGYCFLMGDRRGGQSWIVNGLLGAAIVLGAATLAGLATGNIRLG